MTERISVTPKILSLNESNDIYIKMNVRILSNKVNYNSALFLSSFIDGVINDKEKYNGIPFLVNKEALENGDYLSHELNTETGQLETDQIGSFTDFWKEIDEDNTEYLVGSIKVFKRFPTVCNALIEQFNSGSLSTSCEVLIREYAEISEDGVRSIDYANGRNALIGSCVVSDPACPEAVATLLIAEAYQKDLSENESGDNMSKVKEVNEITVNTLKLEDAEKLAEKFVEMNSQYEKLKKEMELMSKEKEKALEVSEEQLKGLQTKVEELSSKLEESNKLVVSEQEAKAKFESTITELQEQVSHLTVYKNQVEKAELEAKQAELNAKYSKLVSKEVFESEKVQKAIADLNLTELNEVVVAEAIAKSAKQTELSSKKTDDDVVITASKNEDLIEPTTLQKYGL